MTEAELNNDYIVNAAKTIFTAGTVQQRDALRTIANTVLSGKAAFAYEDCSLDIETTYRLLEEIQFTGDGRRMLPADEIVALDNILRKNWRKDFFTAVSNMALTMYSTDPRTAGRGFWPTSHSECALLVHRAFLWVVAQNGLTNLLRENYMGVSHTRLPQFIVAFQVAGKDEGVARHYTLYNAQEDCGTITTNNLLPEDYKEKLAAELLANRPAEYDAVEHMDFDELIELCERLNVIGPNSTKRQATCDCSIDDDCECDEEDEPMTRDDFDKDEVGDLRDHFWQKYGYPDDEPEIPDEDVWIPGVSQMEVRIDLPVVTLSDPDKQIVPRAGMKMKSRAKKPMGKSEPVVLSYAQQIWHELDSKKEFGDRSFAITLVSRHTCGVSRAVATTREALAIATALMDVSK
ncbi:hypothetical protein pEaSNUABM35_00294 [Erwinia phage pEa_SNUABM_35]|uniref:Uncharacterized protein n=1 Tax=Erwinia phage pEa_SNUABM_35 TaxID=2869557 RepID=A0AAE7XRA4_9CAUD|nr:hypothetical protein MPK65_gp294 [Erwinia phage pEa_SNUABM_35]QZE60211.1 hypothetical protein pEaSNUABM35_00294 [Erwinia phage pEa_SNUABM_35]QZE60547.1 hypothetical protein pEaSNUABM36_00294 [Erwinia phage pEa_SNUABM_36]